MMSGPTITARVRLGLRIADARRTESETESGGAGESDSPPRPVKSLSHGPAGRWFSVARQASSRGTVAEASRPASE